MAETVGTTLAGTDTISVVLNVLYTCPPKRTWQATFAVAEVLFGSSVHHESGMAYSRVFDDDVAVPVFDPREKVAV